MVKVAIVGTGGLARSILSCISRINKVKPTYEFLGFIKGNADQPPKTIQDENILGTIADWNPVLPVRLIMGIEEPAEKEIVAQQLKAKGAIFETIVSPDVLLGDNVRFGEGCVIMTPFVIDDDSYFGDFVTVQGATISLDGYIDDYSSLHWFANTTTARIGKRVFLGSHAVVLEGRTIGDDVYIDIGSIVISDIGPGQRVSGYPARITVKSNDGKGGQD